MKNSNTLYMYYLKATNEAKEELQAAIDSTGKALIALENIIEDEIILDKLRAMKSPADFPPIYSKKRISDEMKARVNTYHRIYNENQRLQRELDALSCHPISYSLHHQLLSEYFINVSANILKGNEFYVSHLIGTVKITLRVDYREKHGQVTYDYGESFKLLQKLAEVHAPHLLEKYKSKALLKNDFIKAMKEYTYSPDTPTKPKWLVKRQSTQNLWWTWIRSVRNRHNNREYIFVPTNFINTKSRSQIEFASNAKSEAEIIYSPLLGNRDKLNVLKRFNPLVINKYAFVDEDYKAVE